MSNMADVWSLLTRRRDPAAPLVTWIDGPHRVELSTTTVINGVAKVANALATDLDAGSRVRLDLPWHWQLPIWQGGVWVSERTIAEPADIRIVGEGTPDAPPGSWAVSLDPWGRPITAPLPPGVEDVTAIVRIQPDLLLSPPTRNTAPLIDAEALADDLGIATGDRLLALPGSALLPLLVPLVSGASVVLAQQLDDVDTAREHITHVCAGGP
jgi:uncharacterized protein (TIGR03089 family)